MKYFVSCSLSLVCFALGYCMSDLAKEMKKNENRKTRNKNKNVPTKRNKH